MLEIPKTRILKVILLKEYFDALLRYLLKKDNIVVSVRTHFNGL